MRFALIAGFCWSFSLAQPVAQPFAQGVNVTVKPLSIVSTKRVIGSGRSLGLWTVDVCNDTPAAQHVARARLMAAFPSLPDFPSLLAEDAIGRQAAADPRSIVGTSGDSILGLVSTGLAVGGLSAKSPNMAIAGLAMTGLQLVFRQLKSQAPSPAPYFSMLLPDTVSLDPGACGQWLVYSSVIHDPKALSARVL